MTNLAPTPEAVDTGSRATLGGSKTKLTAAGLSVLAGDHGFSRQGDRESLAHCLAIMASCQPSSGGRRHRFLGLTWRRTWRPTALFGSLLAQGFANGGEMRRALAEFAKTCGCGWAGRMLAGLNVWEGEP